MSHPNNGDILKDLIEQGRESGYLTYEDIHRQLPDSNINNEELDRLYTTLQEMGIPIIRKQDETAVLERQRVGVNPLLEPLVPEEVEAPVQEPPVEMEVDTQNSIRMYLTEMGKVPLLQRDQEINLAKNIKDNEKTLKWLVLESPIAMREIRNWDTLITQDEMTPKELMPRGRKTNQELYRMKTKMRDVVKFINKGEKRMIQAQTKSRDRGLSEKKRDFWKSETEKAKNYIIEKIVSLNLNNEKIKRLTNKIKTLAQRVLETEEEIQRYEKRFKMTHHEIFRVYEQAKRGKISPGVFKKATGYTLTGIESSVVNLENIADKHRRMAQSLPEGKNS